MDGKPQGFKDLHVYQKAYRLALEVFLETRGFPREERFSLTDQLRRSTRSVAANVAEAYRKRRYPSAFVNKLTDADGEVAETQVWLDFSRDLQYLNPTRYSELSSGYEEVGRILGAIIRRPNRFTG